MMSTATMETIAKFLGLMNDLLKFLAMAVLAVLAIGAIAAPDLVKSQLARLGFEIKEVNAGFLKIVATETTKAGGNTLLIAEALTVAELQLKKVEAAALSPAGGGSPVTSVEDAVKTIQMARTALDEQSSAIQETAKAAGVAPNAPTRGWLYVGLFAESGEARLLSDRIGSKDGLKYTGKDLKGIVLRFDAGVVSDGDSCTKTQAADFVPPDPKEPERRYAVLRASPEPLKVLATRSCDTPGSVKSVYAQVEVPKSRVRFSTLSSLPTSGPADK
jgi:hypothetical protein